MIQDDRRDSDGDDPDQHLGAMPPPSGSPYDSHGVVPVPPPAPVVLKPLPREPITLWGSILALVVGAIAR